MKYEIVQFHNDKYGIRRRTFLENLLNFGGDYYDFQSKRVYFWEYQSRCFVDCEIDDFNIAFDCFKRIKGNIIKRVIKWNI
jgi:hypothetical protein